MKTQKENKKKTEKIKNKKIKKKRKRKKKKGMENDRMGSYVQRLRHFGKRLD